MRYVGPRSMFSVGHGLKLLGHLSNRVTQAACGQRPSVNPRPASTKYLTLFPRNRKSQPATYSIVNDPLQEAGPASFFLGTHGTVIRTVITILTQLVMGKYSEIYASVTFATKPVRNVGASSVVFTSVHAVPSLNDRAAAPRLSC